MITLGGVGVRSRALGQQKVCVGRDRQAKQFVGWPGGDVFHTRRSYLLDGFRQVSPHSGNSTPDGRSSGGGLECVINFPRALSSNMTFVKVTHELKITTKVRNFGVEIRIVLA